ncbi:MAG: hypothetical protein ABH872_05960 [Candidatus Omnitrophota bacterium]
MDNFLKLSTVLTIAIHAVFVFGLGPFFPDSSFNQKNKRIKLPDLEIIEIAKKEPGSYEKFEDKTGSPPPPFINHAGLRNIIEENLKNLSLNKPQIIDKITKTISLSDDSKTEELKKNPDYMAYYERIRSAIERNLDGQYSSSSVHGSGDVFVNFSVSNEGVLKKIFMKDKSAKNSSLRSITVSGIKKAAPFPEFPEELKNRKELSFDISIYYKNSK